MLLQLQNSEVKKLSQEFKKRILKIQITKQYHPISEKQRLLQLQNNKVKKLS